MMRGSSARRDWAFLTGDLLDFGAELDDRVANNTKDVLDALQRAWHGVN